MFDGKETVSNKIVCDGRLKASFIIYNKFIVEVHENTMCNYYKKDGTRGMMARARMADEVARESGFTGGYIGISLLEMEYS